MLIKERRGQEPRRENIGFNVPASKGNLFVYYLYLHVFVEFMSFFQVSVSHLVYSMSKRHVLTGYKLFLKFIII